jgi:cytochrome c553
MPSQSRKRVARLAGAGLATACTLLVAGLLFAWSGAYNVAASRGHWAIVEWLLTVVMRNSVEKRSLAIATPPLDDPDLIRLGAAHFHGGCAPCHGAPGIPISPTSQHMLPPPPDLATAVTQWRDRELFWIAKHGIKYTGMPSWASQQRDDEVWAVVAFLKRLPALDPQAYRELAIARLQVARQSGRDIATAEATADAISACARCHGADDWGPPSGLVPILHGQPVEFLAAALQSYADGRRESGIMQPLAAELAQGAMLQVAGYYSGLTGPSARAKPQVIDAAAIDNGRLLATQGLPAAEIPACVTCHGTDALSTYPRLAGQHAAYMRGQLRLWKGGLIARSETSAIMAPIAQRLSDRQIDDVTAYFASLAPSPSGKAQRP